MTRCNRDHALHLAAILCIAACSTSVGAATAVDRVDVFVGTAGDHGQMHPAACWPFGLVKLGPETSGSGHAGYSHDAKELLGFAHTRLGGVGCRGGGGTLMVTPTVGRKHAPAYLTDSEQGKPGNYAVQFANGIAAEMTVSKRVGLHRYRFPAGGDPCLIFDPHHDYHGRGRRAERDRGPLLSLHEDGSLRGTIEGNNVDGKGRHVLHVAVVCNRGWRQLGVDEQQCTSMAIDARPGEEVLLKVGLSPIDQAQARTECDIDLPGWNFVRARDQAFAAWQTMLGRVAIDIDGQQELAQWRDLFYTCLYRSLLVPHDVTASDGRYRRGGRDMDIHRLDEAALPFQYYCGWSTWDDYRKFPLVGLVWPEHMRDIARSVLDLYAAGAPRAWAQGQWPCPSVRNEMMSSIVLDALRKNLIAAEEIAAAYQSFGRERNGNFLEKCYAAYVAMRLAQALGHDEDATRYREEALAYRKRWRPDQVDGAGVPRGFFVQKVEKGVPQDKAEKVDKCGFYEGNLWHYRWWVPHDMAGVVELDGGQERFVDNLQAYFEGHQHMALNEPPMAYPFLFVYGGRADLTQKWSRMYTTETVEHRYHNHGFYKKPVIRPTYLKQPAGWLPTMDDDTGAMSSQFVYQALGLYPACPGDPYWIIGSPLFPSLTIALPGGKVFIVRTTNNSLKHYYIQSATLNGEQWDRAWLTHAQLLAGGELHLQMGAEPNPDWGGAPPPSLSDPTEGR